MKAATAPLKERAKLEELRSHLCAPSHRNSRRFGKSDPFLASHISSNKAMVPLTVLIACALNVMYKSYKAFEVCSAGHMKADGKGAE